MYTNLLDGTHREDSGYRTYLIDRTLSISLKENVNIISEGTTGLYTWQVDFLLVVSQQLTTYETFFIGSLLFG